ncbi:MFS transporter [Longibaculum muris]|uniref:MFS transporter n=1 Tax=Longibaculum muris TaxID=1796628 RepID=UPI0022E42DAD|nr:MFS transporter [Longibaculum muris]
MSQKRLQFALLSASLLVGSAAAINANIPAMAQHFKDVPLSMVEMLTTIPSLFLMISVFISTFIAKRLGYKQTIMLGLAIVMISGLIPLWIDNFIMILMSRGALGFGIGLFNSLLVSMINYFYEPQMRSSMYGLQSAFEGAGGIFITFLAGQLLKINWQAPFIAYGIAIPVFFIYLKYVPKVETKDMEENTELQTQQANQKNASFLPVLSYVILIFIAAMLYMIMGIKIASLMNEVGYGTASDASFVIIVLSLGGISAGLFFGKILKILKQYTTTIGLLLLSLAMLILGMSQHLIMTFIGGFLIGFGFKIFMPSLIDKINNSNIPHKNLATSLLLVGFNLGVFISPYGSVLIQNLIGTENLPILFITNALFFMILSSLTFLITTIKSKKMIQMTQNIIEQ